MWIPAVETKDTVLHQAIVSFFCRAEYLNMRVSEDEWFLELKVIEERKGLELLCCWHISKPDVAKCSTEIYSPGMILKRFWEA